MLYLSNMLSNPIFYLILFKLGWFVLKTILPNVFKEIFAQQDQEAKEYVFNRLSDNAKFINDCIEIVNKSKKLGSEEAKLISEMPIVASLSEKAEKRNNKKQKKLHKIAGVSKLTIQNEIKLSLLKAWEDNSINNAVVEKIKASVFLK